MGACPFCRGQVSQEILSNGGHCPKCLIEIPGEETATDPGELAKAHIAAEAEATNKSRRGLVIGIVVVSVLGLGMGGLTWVFTKPDDTGAYMETDDSFSFAPVGSHQNLDMPEGGDPADPEAAAGGSAARSGSTGSGSTGNGSTGARSGGGSRGSVARTSPPPTGGTPATPPEQPPAAQGSLVPSASSGSPSARSGASPDLADPLSAFSVVGGGPANKGPQGIVLSAPGEIYDMVQGVFAVKGNQMKQCYEQRLKVKEDLRGSWTASFTIQGNGRTANVVVKGDDIADKELESCMKTKVQGWTFQAIAEPFRIDKSFRFGR
jgi:hypothetical protein